MKNLVFIFILLFSALTAKSQAPTLQASNIRFFNISQDYTTIKWTMGDGAKRAVFVKEGAGAITLPSNGTTYTASSDWNTKGSQLGSSGYFCVYNGPGYLVTVPGFPISTVDDPADVSVYIFEYNGEPGSESYLTSSAVNNPVTGPVLKQPEDMCEPYCAPCTNEVCTQPGYREYLDLTNGLVNGYTTGLPLVSLDFMAYEDGDSPCSFIWKDVNCKKSGSNYVTIGINIDLGKLTAATLRTMGVSDSVITVLTPVLGLKNPGIISYCAQNNYTKCHVELSPIGRTELNEKYHYAKATELQTIFNLQKSADVPNFENLPLGVRTSIYSNYSFYGAAMLMKKPFWSFVIKGDWQSAIEWLRMWDLRRSDEEALIMEMALLPPNAVGGVVTAADTVVNCGTNSALLTLSGYTGSIRKWQFSTNNSAWQDISGATSATYTVVNLAEDTWFRAMIAGAQDSAASTAWKLTVFPKYRITGYARYQNNPLTPLNGLKILLRKGQTMVDSVYTSATGYFAFNNKTNGTFGFKVQSAYPGGQWQTWGGVNNTDALLVLRHISNTLPLPANPPVICVAASVKIPHPAIQNNDYLAIRQAAKSGWGYFDTTRWVFSGVNAAAQIDTFSLACENLSRDIRGLCAGDVNGTYVPPTGVKTLHATSLQLINRGSLPITPEITFPIRAERDMELGAITLMLDYDPAQIEITGVTMPGNVNEQPVWHLAPDTWHLAPDTWHLNILHIGWMSMDPVRLAENQTMLLIHARLTEAFQVSSVKCQVPDVKCQVSDSKCQIRFALNDNPLSELADGDGNVIDGVKLVMPEAGRNGEMVKWRNGEIVCYPNPVKDVLSVEFVVNNVDVKTGQGMSLQLVTIHGVVVAKQNVADIKAGMNKTTMNLRDLPNGAYLLKVLSEDQVVVRKVIVNR